MSRGLLHAFIVGLLSTLALAASGTSALASPSPIHYYSFNTTNNTGTTSDNARFFIWGVALPNFPTAPDWLAPAFSSTFWPAPSTTTAFLWRWVTWTGGVPTVPAGQTRWFGVRTQVVPTTGKVFLSHAYFQWNAVSGTAGSPVTLGWKISSPPALFNSTDSPFGGSNTHNLVVRNVRYAQSPYAVSIDSLRLDNPTVLARFSESADVARAGPFVVAPGDTQAFAVHPSILDPTPGGRTILVQGTTEDWNGAQVQFVSQFAQPLNMPGTSPLGMVILGLILATLGVLFVARVRSARMRTAP